MTEEVIVDIKCPVCEEAVDRESLSEHFYRHFVVEEVKIKDIGMTEDEYCDLKYLATGVERKTRDEVSDF